MTAAVLAIWNDCAPGREAAYEEWYQGEHLPERLDVPGFRSGRRFEAVDAPRRFHTVYEVDSTDVLVSAPYLERLEHPTARTRAMMADGFVNARRVACRRTAVRGGIRGAVVVTVVHPVTAEQVRGGLDLSALEHRPVDAELCHAEAWLPSGLDTGREPSAEERLRGPDETMAGGLVLEFLRQDPALRAAEQLRSRWPDAEIGTYRLLALMSRDGLSAC